MDRLTRFLRLAGLLLVGVVVIPACGASEVAVEPSLPSYLQGLPESGLHADDVIYYSSAEELFDTSEAVVVGTISSVTEGRFRPAPALEDFGGDYVMNVEMTIEEVLSGGDFAPGDTVVIETPGYQVDEEGTPSEIDIVNGMPFPRVGSHELWFLTHSEEHGWYPSDLDDGRYRVSGDNLTALADSAGPAAREVEDRGLAGMGG